jgi:adenylylsulfate kinase-like enzyme
VKGLYRRALAGEIPRFTGVSDPYEAPVNPALSLDTQGMTVDEGVAQVLAVLRARSYLPDDHGAGASIGVK